MILQLHKLANNWISETIDQTDLLLRRDVQEFIGKNFQTHTRSLEKKERREVRKSSLRRGGYTALVAVLVTHYVVH